ncbi:ribonuclease H-like domain-containing protein [Tanacetum coccineum]
MVIPHIFPLPKSPVVADSNWRDAMYDEYNALIRNSTWILVPKPPNANVVRSMWLFQHKYHANGSLSRYKARLVANGRSHQYGVDCDDTFSPVVKPATIPSLALSRLLISLMLKMSFLTGIFLRLRLLIWDNLLSWSAKRQHTLFRSSAEAEYRGVANVVAETAWLRNLLRELHMPLSSATLVYCDNVSAIYLTANPVRHQRTKHIEIDIHFVRDMVARVMFVFFMCHLVTNMLIYSPKGCRLLYLKNFVPV